jgi:TrmH family RNA methyltransferase
MLITSLDNKKIKKYYELKSSKKRHEEKLFLVEGMHLCLEAYKHHLLTDILLLEGEKLEFDYNQEINYVTDKILKKLSSLTTYSKVIGVCKMGECNEIKGKHILLLDGIQDPGNMGTIIRSAKAFNIDTIILSTDSVDIYNDKVLRSTQGLMFDMNIYYDDLENVINELKKKHYLILGTDVKNGVDVRDVKSNKYALIMGNEGHGVRDSIKKMCDKNLYIKMNNNCESLNVAVATSILLYELERGTNE